jgi:signal transduction histidine kinase
MKEEYLLHPANFFTATIYRGKPALANDVYKDIIIESLQFLVDKQGIELNAFVPIYRVEVRVKDNGNGIPQKVVDKIFQPFFTTKPTGIGTGLGLSLSYDIVKAHGGEIKVESKEGEGSEFIITLPV